MGAYKNAIDPTIRYRKGKKMFPYRLLALVVLLPVTLTPCHVTEGEDKDEKEAMEVGGLLTVDGANKFKDWENTPAELGTVQLSATVHVAENMEGSITLQSENDPDHIAIDQAVGLWTLGDKQIVFGEQYFRTGLFSTRMISDPLVLDLGEFHQPGVTGAWAKGTMNFGLGLTSLATGPDSALNHDPCLVASVDVAPGSHALRIASQLSRERQAVDGAANLVFGMLLLDAEALWRWKDDDGVAKGGYTAGIALQLNDVVQVAGRWDGLGDEEQALNHQRFGGGVTISLVEHVFGSGEIAWDEVDGPVFALQMGLQSTLKLPGFQRKTLTK
jgi:hypothetical protein